MTVIAATSSIAEFADPQRGTGDASGGTASIIFSTAALWPPQATVLQDTAYGPTGADYTGSLVVSAPSAADIAAAVLALAQVTPIHADMRKTMGTALKGDGTETDKFRSTLVP